MERLAAALRSRGVDVEGPIEHDGGDRSIYVFDPEGNRVELWDYFEDGDAHAIADHATTSPVRPGFGTARAPGSRGDRCP